MAGTVISQTNTLTVSTKVQAVYDRMLLTRAIDNTVWDMFGQAKTIPAKSNTKKGFARRYKNILPATTPLAEYNGTVKGGNKIVSEEVEFSVAHYGDYVMITDELELYNYDNIQSVYTDILGDQADLTVETIRRDALRGGTNVIYAGGAISRKAMIDAAKAKPADGLATIKDLKTAALKLKKQRGRKFKKVITGSTAVGTTPIRSAYIGVISQEVTEDYRELAGWKNVEDYANYGNSINEDEVGSYGDFRFVESTNNDPIVAQGTAGTDVNVYPTILLAQDAYATTTLRGKGGIRAIVKAIGSAGANDPLEQYGSFGWKCITGCAILNEAWLIRLEQMASMEISTAKHYIDYSAHPNPISGLTGNGINLS